MNNDELDMILMKFARNMESNTQAFADDVVAQARAEIIQYFLKQLPAETKGQIEGDVADITRCNLCLADIRRKLEASNG